MRFFEKLVSALCSEGYCTEASEYFLRTKETDPGWVPSVRVYNVMLNGWFRARKFKHAERLWEEMKNENVRPSAVTYDTLVKLYCQMGCVEKALKMIGEMTKEGIEPNTTVYNPIIDALAGAGRFEEALGMMERFHVLQIGPDLSTYNSLVKGFCKARDLEGVKKILKNMIESGHDPDRLTYHLVLKMLCLEEKLELAVQVSKQMRHKGHGMNLATSTMLTHLLCKMNKLEDAFAEFEDMIRRGLIPQYLTFQKLNVELMKQGMTEMAQKLCQLMSSVPHSTNLPSTYGEVRDDANARSAGLKHASIWWRDICKVGNAIEGDCFGINVNNIVGDDKELGFWKEKWLCSGPLRELFPSLFILSTQQDACIADMGLWVNNTWIWNLSWTAVLPAVDYAAEGELLLLLEDVKSCRVKPDRHRWIPHAAGLFFGSLVLLVFAEQVCVGCH
ncbi:pentatricopeptide repeat-containing protein mitochondrial-like [Trifolium pratense]|uniref:Pentatricopeptide repeat-containing protein mitochondrial-like n=1 Tax=Trifolium pratense TaxID=57577 RepID=A0A2K3NLT7_TRIPR|nr:pentatricopeptide repeat-containing protein mitochondrial-like [Trifolium pratense]